MSYLGSQATLSVVVSAEATLNSITLELVDVVNNPDNSFTWGGNQVVVGGYAYDQYGNPVAGAKVHVYYPLTVYVGGPTTNSAGYFQVTFTCAYGKASGAMAKAFSEDYSIESNTFTLPLYGKTRIRSLAASPSIPKTGQLVTVSGFLEEETATGVWGAVAAQIVDIVATAPSGAPVSTSGTTLSNGSFSGTFTPAESGTWSVTATFSGAAMLLGASGEAALGMEAGIPILFLAALIGLTGYALYKSGR